MPPHGVIDTAYFSDKARTDLLQLLQSVPGKKNLVLAKALVGAVESLVKFSTLQEYGVHRVFFLENENVDSSQRDIIFLASGEKVKQAQIIAAQIKKLRQVSQNQHDFSVLWTPRRTLVCGKILEEAGVLGDVSSLEFPLFFQPLESDLLSMEIAESFGDLYLRRDPTSIFLAAKALMLIQQRHGLFPRIIGKGANAKRLASLLIRLRSEPYTGESNVTAGTTYPSLMPSSSIESIVIIDRDVDFASVLLTQLTYEGLIDELFGISHGQTEVDSSVIGASPNLQSQGSSSSGDVQPSQPQHGLKRKVILDSSDKLYNQLRDVNFATVGSLLNKVARRLQNDFDGRHGNKTTAELREFVNKLPGYQAEQQSLKIHTNLAEEVLKQTRSDLFSRSLEVQQNMIAGTNPTSLHDNIEELIARDCPLATVLRLLCLESCMTGGLRPKDLDSFKRQIVQAYGYQHVMTLAALEKMQLLQPSGPSVFHLPGTGSSAAEGTRTNYSAVRKPLQLIVDDVNEQDPTDIAYTYSGYAPLSVRLVQCVLQKQSLTPLTKATAATAAAAAPNADAAQGWRGFENVLKNVKGETFEMEQTGADKSARARQVLNGQAEKKTTMVFFVGGVTFAEIAALRLVARQEAERGRVLICTTGILSGERMMRAAIETSEIGLHQ